MARGAVRLLEREAELAAVEDALKAARSRDGAALLFEGPPGIGKTELLLASSSRARHRRLLVLSARGGELEQSFAFGVVQQLFESTLAAAGARGADELLSGAAAHCAAVVDPRAVGGRSDVGDPGVVFHGLYWLTANLAEQRPLVLIVDDVHWSDAASLEWLVYLCRRIEGLPVAVVLAARPNEPGAITGRLAPVHVEGIVRRVRPTPLSASAAKAMARQALGPTVEASFAVSCHAATGGNPFYLTELLRTLRSDGVAGGVEDATAVERVTPEAVLDATLARLGRTTAVTRSVAEAVAVLEPQAELRYVSELAGVDSDVATAALDSLLAMGMLGSLDPCRFSHPVLRMAVEASIEPARRQRAHARAARLLEGSRGSLGAVAAHLLRSSAAGDAGTVTTLRRAAAEARARGAAGEAVSYLARALREPPEAPERGAVLLELGSAEAMDRRPEAAGHLQEALATAETPGQIAAATLALGQTLMYTGDLDAAYGVAQDAARRLAGHDDPLTLGVETLLLSVATLAGRAGETAERAAALESRLSSDSSAECSVLAQIAIRGLWAGSPRAQVARLADRALFRGELSFTQTQFVASEAPGLVLMWLDDLDRAEALFTVALEAAQRMGSLQCFTNFTAARGLVLQRRGQLTRAEADVDHVLTLAHGEGVPLPRLVALIAKALVLVDRGEPQAAERLAGDAPLSAGLERQPAGAVLRHAQGVAQLAQHRYSDAVCTLSGVGAVFAETGVVSPAIAPWRSDLALALAGIGRREEALEHTREELDLAERTGVNRARGNALRALGLLAGGQQGLDLLDEAVGAFQLSSAQLEYARALCEVGSALRRTNRRRDARSRLEPALDLALDCGAHALVARIRTELRATGARPRAVVLSGVDLLTASERRVCELAVEGLTNPEIAQALFVTRKTVETHLGHAYRKLDISSRRELPSAMRELA